ncbi:MAG: metal-dependent hydrolase [Saezia sp.]
MFIAHIPSGYITVKLLCKRIKQPSLSIKWLFFWGLLGSVAPDLDMFYFYLIDARQNNHHSYWSHYPILWFPALFMSYVSYRRSSSQRFKNFMVYATLFSFTGCMHLILDSVVGGIWWLAPFIDRPYSLFPIYPKFKIWWLNFIISWVFLIEILITSYAIFLWRKSRSIKMAITKKPA